MYGVLKVVIDSSEDVVVEKKSSQCILSDCVQLLTKSGPRLCLEPDA
jgi:hypothetical protein